MKSRVILAACWVVMIIGIASVQGHAQTPQSADSDVPPCAPAPCVVPPVWPSTSAFTANAPIASNPLRPEQIFLGSNDSSCPTFMAFYLSIDGGESWQQMCAQGFSYKGNEYEPVNQPTVSYDSRGTAYQAAQYGTSDDFASGGLVAIRKSSDGGRTWSAPVPAAGHRNVAPGFSRLALDASVTSPRADSVYIVSVFFAPIDSAAKNQLVVSHSSDGGKHWIQVPLTPVEPNNRRELRNPNLTVGGDGTVYVTWLLRNVFDPSSRAEMLFSKSSDGGNTWSPPTRIATIVLHGLPNAFLAVPINVPAIGVDNSGGPNSGNLYVAMNTWTGTYLRVGVIRSTDSGKTWQKPVWVEPPNQTHDQFFPWLSVSPAGLVGVSWMDRRNDPANVLYQAFAAISRDGGQSFGPNVLLSDGFSDPGRSGEGNGWIGDYTGNTWAGPNYFVAAWMDNSQTPNMEDVVGGIRLH
ncbi:MAG: glycoside hydrolase [Acidobacteriia bacterium]|nr:glycoside hydrolase [Terriglobia bacterium]